MAKGDRGRGLPAGVQSLESFRRRNTHVHKMQSVPAPSLSSLAPPHLSGPLPRPQRRFWGYSCRTVHSGPTPLASPASSPLLGPGSKKVLGWADSGGNSIEFSFGYILKAKVSWTYSQNGSG